MDTKLEGVMNNKSPLNVYMLHHPCMYIQVYICTQYILYYYVFIYYTYTLGNIRIIPCILTTLRLSVEVSIYV